MITNNPKKQDVSKYIALGGPTLTTVDHVDGIVFLHCLLDTNKKHQHWITDGDNVFFVMGNVYSHSKKILSDIYYVVSAYNQYGEEFVEELDGEFLITIYNQTSKQLHFFTDMKKTRTVWHEQYGDRFYFGTLPRTNADMIFEPTHISSSTVLLHNSHYIFDTNTSQLIHQSASVHKWDKYVEDKEEYDGWMSALESAIIKRYHKTTAVLIDGIESVATALCLADNKKPFTTIYFNKDFNNPADHVAIYKQMVSYCGEFISPYVVKSHPEICREARFDNSIQLTKVQEAKLDGHKILPLINVAALYNRQVVMLCGEQDVYDVERINFICHMFGIEPRFVFSDKRLMREYSNLNYDLKKNGIAEPLKQFLKARGIDTDIIQEKG
jgi:hypothetical protein